MKIVIVSKTKMSSNDCVGGIGTKTGQFVRLLDENGRNQPENCNFEIGEIWDIEFSSRNYCTPPHIEDVLISSNTYTQKKVSKKRLSEWIPNNFANKVWRGNIDNLFDKMIRFTSNGSGYINEENGIPDCSVGFWIADKDLTRKDYRGKVKYSYPSSSWRNIPYVGKDEPISTIPAGTLMRVSLARWWSPNDSDLEERCYLQLSGWYF